MTTRMREFIWEKQKKNGVNICDDNLDTGLM